MSRDVVSVTSELSCGTDKAFLRQGAKCPACPCEKLGLSTGRSSLVKKRGTHLFWPINPPPEPSYNLLSCGASNQPSVSLLSRVRNQDSCNFGTSRDEGHPFHQTLCRALLILIYNVGPAQDLNASCYVDLSLLQDAPKKMNGSLSPKMAKGRLSLPCCTTSGSPGEMWLLGTAINLSAGR
jgi:hypothetical protein